MAETYRGENEYREVYLDDRLAVQSFFGLSGSTSFSPSTNNVADVHLVFFVHLPSLKPGLKHRGDEEVRKDVQQLLPFGIHGFQLDGIRVGIDRVFDEYRGSIQAAQANLDGLKFRDMHPFHCFRFDFKLYYSNNYC